ncbi:MAG: SPOR domain-containing protein, partial [Clostridia bacterium]|nr:SPOR domain-containing protein [Clostridia bacterium]
MMHLKHSKQTKQPRQSKYARQSKQSRYSKSSSRLRAKRYPAGRSGQRAMALAMFALALFVLTRLIWPVESEGPGQRIGPTPLAPVTPTPVVTVAPTVRPPTPVPTLNEEPQPGFAPPESQEERSQSIFIPKLDWYLIQLGAYSTAEAAQQQARVYTGRGAAGFILEDDRFRVIAAAYPTQQDAETIRARLGESQGIETYVYRLSTDEVELNVTAAAGQIQALQDGFDALHVALIETGRLSIELDKQQIDGAAVILGAQDARLRVQDASRTLEAVL